MSSQMLEGKVALVTGAAKGIGLACAIAMAEAGADVILGLKEKTTGAEGIDAIRKMGRAAFPVQMDISKLDEIDAAITEGMQHFGHIDILVNNAGIGAPNKAEDVTEKDFDATIVPSQ